VNIVTNHIITKHKQAQANGIDHCFSKKQANTKQKQNEPLCLAEHSTRSRRERTRQTTPSSSFKKSIFFVMYFATLDFFRDTKSPLNVMRTMR
jgi:hypothetical protein